MKINRRDVACNVSTITYKTYTMCRKIRPEGAHPNNKKRYLRRHLCKVFLNRYMYYASFITLMLNSTLTSLCKATVALYCPNSLM